MFPSTFNRDHKWTFTIVQGVELVRPSPSTSLELLSGEVGHVAQTIKVEQLDATFRSSRLQRFDQTLTPVGEWCARVHLAQARRPTKWQGAAAFPKRARGSPRDSL